MDEGGGKLKTTGFKYWVSPNKGATNEYKFSALPGGRRDPTGTYRFLKYYVMFWTSTTYSSDKNKAYHLDIMSHRTNIRMNPQDKRNHYSVRYVKN
jgi:uncharacterized protein (TIGR02145 family)